MKNKKKPDRLYVIVALLVILLVGTATIIMSINQTEKSSSEEYAKNIEKQSESLKELKWPVQKGVKTKPVEELIEESKTIIYDAPIPRQYYKSIASASFICKYRGVNIEPSIITAMIIKESGGDPLCVGDNGDSIGFMQIQPKWWQWLADKEGADIYNPEENIMLGAEILAMHLEANNGNMEHALTQYNTGKGGKSSKYAKSVLEIEKNLKVLEIVE